MKITSYVVKNYPLLPPVSERKRLSLFFFPAFCFFRASPEARLDHVAAMGLGPRCLLHVHPGLPGFLPWKRRRIRLQLHLELGAEKGSIDGSASIQDATGFKPWGSVDRDPETERGDLEESNQAVAARRDSGARARRRRPLWGPADGED